MKVPNNRSICSIPLDLLMEILFHLPLKSILRFRSVSKSWKSIIEDPNFSVYIKRRPNNIQDSYLIFSEKHKLETRWVRRCSKTPENALEIEFPIDRTRRWEVCGGVDGLILLLVYGESKTDNAIVLWNPSIRKTINLPPNPFKLPAPFLQEGFTSDNLCLLLDTSENDCKVVLIHCHVKDFRSISAPLVDVFSLKSHSWRRVVDGDIAPATARVCLPLTNGRTACTGESAHWIGFEESNNIFTKNLAKVISFDLISKTFTCTPFPKDYNRHDTCQVIGLSGSILGFLVLTPPNHVTIWAMEKSSSTTTSVTQQCCWTRRYQFNVIAEGRFCKYFCASIQNLDVFFRGYNKSLRSYDMESDTEKEKVMLSNSFCWPEYIGSYVESLLLM